MKFSQHLCYSLVVVWSNVGVELSNVGTPASITSVFIHSFLFIMKEYLKNIALVLLKNNNIKLTNKYSIETVHFTCVYHYHQILSQMHVFVAACGENLIDC